MNAETEKPLTYLSVTEEHLRKIFEESKSSDLTKSQFEQEKTKRISALCEALKSVAQYDQSGGCGEKSPRAEIMSQLTKACDSFYQPFSYLQ